MLTYRWLGAAGLELRCAGSTLLVDPFFSRPPRRALLTLAPLRGDPALSARLAPQADALLVTHAHYDHLLDVPEIALRSGAPVYGSANTQDLLALNGVPANQARQVQPGDRFRVGPFAVEVFPAWHTPVPFARWLTGPLPRRLRQAAERARQQSGPPARLPRLGLFDYRMDACYSYHIQADGQTLLVGNLLPEENRPAPCDLLFLAPYSHEKRLAELLRAARPRQVVLIHWDDFNQPLGPPPQPMLVMPAQDARQTGRRLWPLRRLDVPAFARLVQSLLPGADVRLAEMFREEQVD